MASYTNVIDGFPRHGLLTCDNNVDTEVAFVPDESFSLRTLNPTKCKMRELLLLSLSRTLDTSRAAVVKYKDVVETHYHAVSN